MALLRSFFGRHPDNVYRSLTRVPVSHCSSVGKGTRYARWLRNQVPPSLCSKTLSPGAEAVSRLGTGTLFRQARQRVASEAAFGCGSGRCRIDRRRLAAIEYAAEYTRRAVMDEFRGNDSGWVADCLRAARAVVVFDPVAAPVRAAGLESADVARGADARNFGACVSV